MNKFTKRMLKFLGIMIGVTFLVVLLFLLGMAIGTRTSSNLNDLSAPLLFGTIGAIVWELLK